MEWTDDVPVPAGLEPLRVRGAFDVRIALADAGLLQLLGAGTGGHPETFRYRAPVDIDWPALVDFYAARLPRPWQRVGVPEQQLSFRVAVWRRRRLLGSRLLRPRTVAVALLEDLWAGAEVPDPFGVVIVGREPRDRP